MTDEKQCASARLKIAEKSHAFLLKKYVAYREGFVDNQDVCIHVRNNGKGKPDKHSAGISLDRLIDEISDICERQDAWESLVNAFLAKSMQGASHADILSTGEFGIETRT